MSVGTSPCVTNLVPCVTRALIKDQKFVLMALQEVCFYEGPEVCMICYSICMDVYVNVYENQLIVYQQCVKIKYTLFNLMFVVECF